MIKTMFALAVYLGVLAGIGYGAVEFARGGGAIKIAELIDQGLEWLRPAEKRDSAWIDMRAPPKMRGAADEQ